MIPSLSSLICPPPDSAFVRPVHAVNDEYTLSTVMDNIDDSDELSIIIIDFKSHCKLSSFGRIKQQFMDLDSHLQSKTAKIPLFYTASISFRPSGFYLFTVSSLTFLPDNEIWHYMKV